MKTGYVDAEGACTTVQSVMTSWKPLRGEHNPWHSCSTYLTSSLIMTSATTPYPAKRLAWCIAAGVYRFDQNCLCWISGETYDVAECGFERAALRSRAIIISFEWFKNHWPALQSKDSNDYEEPGGLTLRKRAATNSYDKQRRSIIE